MDSHFCENKEEWNNFVVENNGSFLQTFEWGQLQQRAGQKIFRIVITENNIIVAQVQLTKETSLSKNYFYIAFGPVFKNNLSATHKAQAINYIIDKLKELSVTENCIFLRIEPLGLIEGIEKYKVKTPPRRVQPKKTLILDPTKTEDELFKTFSRTTKYNIGLAKRTGVTIKESSIYSPEFYGLLEKTKNRQEFGIYSEKHYKEIFEINNSAIKASLFSAKYNNKTTNATIVLFFNNRATTLHSGSDYQFRNVKASNLLNWEILLHAKKSGFKELDLWGIDEKKWPTLTSFKKGFGGTELEYPEGVDIIFNNFWYKIYEIIKAVKK